LPDICRLRNHLHRKKLSHSFPYPFLLAFGSRSFNDMKEYKKR
jgi:hypothetical protein